MMPNEHFASSAAATPVAVEKARRAPSPRRHRLEENPPPPIRAFSIGQIEAEHPGFKGRLPSWIKRADAGDPAFAWLRFAIIRIGRSVFIDDVRFRDGLHQHTAMPPAPSRRGAADMVQRPGSSIQSDANKKPSAVTEG